MQYIGAHFVENAEQEQQQDSRASMFSIQTAEWQMWKCIQSDNDFKWSPGWDENL